MAARRVLPFLVPAAVLTLAGVSYALVRALLAPVEQVATAGDAPTALAAGGAGLPIALALITWGSVLVLAAAAWAQRAG